MKEECSVVGKSLPLIDAYEKVTGKLKYAGDLPPLSRMHYAKVLRSPYAHAKVVHIDTSKAATMEGVSAVLTHKDSGAGWIGKGCGEAWVDPSFNFMGPVMADEVCFVGDEVAAVSAVDEETAKKALELIEVEYEELPAIFDMEEAIKPDAPHVRPWCNALNPSLFEWGNPEKGFEEADFIIEHRTTMGNQQHAPLDRNACIANWTGDELAIWTSSQSMFWLREAISNFFGLPFGKVRIYSTPTGGSFGFWWENNFMFLAIVLARKAQRPVRLILNREEVQTTVKRRERPITYIKLGVKNDGKLIAQTHRHLLDNGAYGNKFDPYQSVADMYTTPHGRTEFIGVATNLVTAGCMRGVGDLTLCYGIEQAIDRAAEKLDMDPVEFRLKNHFQPGDVLHTSQEVLFAKVLFNKTPEDVLLTSSGMPECINKGAEMIGWKEKWRGWGKPVAVNGSTRKGIGMAISTHISGLALFGFNGAIIKIASDGSIAFTTGIGRMGQGSDTTQAQVAAETLGVHLEDIHVIDGDTQVCPHTMATFGSNGMHMVSRATMAAAADAKRQVLELAAEVLETNPENLDIKDRRIYVKGSPEKGIELKKLMSTHIYKYLAAPEIIGKACQGVNFEKSGKMMMADFVEVEVDTRTGQLKILKFVAVHDSGTIVNPAVCENQVSGGMFQGMGFTLSEHLIFDEETGAILNPNFVDYKILSALDLPDPDIHFVEVYDEDGPYGAKGIGEGVTCAVPAAVASAVHNAIGVRIDPPITSDKILRAIKRGES